LKDVKIVVFIVVKNVCSELLQSRNIYINLCVYYE
jgi:hypothetical protein